MSERPAWNLERYQPLLRVLLRQMHLDPRLKTRFDDSDLLQETLLRAHQNLPGFKGVSEGELVQWLEQILGHVVIDAVRRERAHKRDPALEQSLQNALAESSARLDHHLQADQSSPSQRAARHEELLRLAEALDQLPEDERDVVIQRYMLGAAVAEISARLGRTEKAVASLLYRAQRRLRGLLAPRE